MPPVSPRPHGRAPYRRPALIIGSTGALVAGGVGAGLLLGMHSAGAANTYTVTSLLDDGTPGTLRWAITQANADPFSTIAFGPSLTGTITLTGSLPVITSTMTIDGPGRSVVTIDGANGNEIFHVDGAVSATISGLTLTNTVAGSASLPALHATNGSTLTGDDLTVSNTRLNAIYNGAVSCDNSTVTLTNSDLADNSTRYTFNQGVVWGSACAVTISDTTITGTSGLPIEMRRNASLDMARSTISGSSSTGIGTLFVYGATASLVDSTISDNSSRYTTIALTGGTLTIANSTISGNSSSGGFTGVIRGESSIATSGQVNILDSTITNNTASKSTLYASSNYHDASFTTIGSIISGNSTPGSFGSYDNSSYAPAATWTSQASLLSAWVDPITTDLGDNVLNNTNPGLGPLADNGGPTLTHEVLATSPALDAGPTTVPTFPGNQWDQRGIPFTRVYNGRADIGAFERQPTPTATLSYTGTTLYPTGTTTVALQAEVTESWCRDGSFEFRVDGNLVATVAIDPVTGRAGVPASAPSGATSLAIDVRLVGSLCTASPLTTTITIGSATTTTSSTTTSTTSTSTTSTSTTSTTVAPGTTTTTGEEVVVPQITG